MSILLFRFKKRLLFFLNLSIVILRSLFGVCVWVWLFVFCVLSFQFPYRRIRSNVLLTEILCLIISSLVVRWFRLWSVVCDYDWWSVVCLLLLCWYLILVPDRRFWSSFCCSFRRCCSLFLKLWRCLLRSLVNVYYLALGGSDLSRRCCFSSEVGFSGGGDFLAPGSSFFLA